MGKHEPGKSGGAGREARAQSSPQQNPIWAMAAIGGIVLVGIITALNIPRSGGKAALLEEQVHSQREREQQLGPAGRHKDIETQIEDLRAFRNDTGFANLTPAKQEYVRARLQELVAYREYEKKLAAITDPKDAHNEEQLERGRGTGGIEGSRGVPGRMERYRGRRSPSGISCGRSGTQVRVGAVQEDLSRLDPGREESH